VKKGVMLIMEFRAAIKKSGDWWIGWLIDLPGVNAQERSKEKLIESLRMGAEDMLATPFEPKEEEELVRIKV
jgi:predicted RNase H-like HicB family nuclease